MPYITEDQPFSVHGHGAAYLGVATVTTVAVRAVSNSRLSSETICVLITCRQRRIDLGLSKLSRNTCTTAGLAFCAIA